MRTPVKLILATMLVVVVAHGVRAQAVGPSPESLGQAVREVERLDALRSTLAGAFGGKGVSADAGTFQQVCRPVGQQGQQMAQDNGWVFVQLAERYRNPRHRLGVGDQPLFRLFADNPDLFGLWMRTEQAGRSGTRYLRRIRVEAACLACHGPEGQRPEFVKQRYPDDRAHGFAVGDLRGLYAVFIPDAR
jgi:hypothetical protein